MTNELITINKLELASELAHEKLLSLVHLSGGKFEIYKEGEDEVRYTEQAQDEFNKHYDRYLTLIESCNANKFLTLKTKHIMETKQTTTLYSSHGNVVINSETGKVLEVNLDDKEDNDCYLLHIDRFDISEFKNWFLTRYGINPDVSELDVLELGFWKKNGEYDNANNKWRYEIREELEKDGTLIVNNQIPQH